MDKRWLWITLGALALLGVLLIGLIVGAGVTFFIFNVRPAHAALDVKITPPKTLSTQEGVLIAEVIPESPAEQAGLLRGDIILKFAGKEVNSLSELTTLVRDQEPGDQVDLVIRRGTEQLTFSVELGEENGQTFLGIRACGDIRVDVIPFGKKVVPFISSEPAFLIQKVIPDSPADKAGIEPGDQITAIDGEPVQADQSLAEIIQAHKPGDEITLEVIRPGEETSREISVVLGENPDKEGQAYLGVEYVNIPGIRIRPLDREDLPFHFQFEFPWPGDRQPARDQPET